MADMAVKEEQDLNNSTFRYNLDGRAGLLDILLER